jgi:hypothetical protein
MKAANSLAKLVSGPETVLSTLNHRQCGSADGLAIGGEV